MKIEILKWEIGILLSQKFELQKIGRDLVYEENNRLSKLRDELDKYADPKTENEEEKKSLDIPL